MLQGLIILLIVTGPRKIIWSRNALLPEMADTAVVAFQINETLTFPGPSIS
jgi:hypothetical protein